MNCSRYATGWRLTSPPRTMPGVAYLRRCSPRPSRRIMCANWRRRNDNSAFRDLAHFRARVLQTPLRGGTVKTSPWRSGCGTGENGKAGRNTGLGVTSSTGLSSFR
jgi:hypothetical protein